MGHHDDGHAGIPLDFAKEREDGFTGGAVKISGGLIGKENPGAIDKRPGDSGALLFAAGKLAGPMADALGEPDAFQRFADAGGAVTAVDFSKAER